MKTFSHVRVLIALLVLASTGAQAIQQSDSVTRFTTEGRSMWGPDDSKPGDALFNLFNFSWNEGVSVRKIEGFDDYGNFGGAVAIGTNGGFRFGLGLTNVDDGSVSVEAPIRYFYRWDEEKSYHPGSAIKVETTTQILTDDPVKILIGRPSASLKVDGKITFGANASAEICFGQCLSIPALGFNLSSPDIPLFGVDVDAEVPSVDVPSAPGVIKIGPAKIGLVTGTGSCNQNQLEVAEFGFAYNLSGISGCLGAPNFHGKPAVLEFRPPPTGPLYPSDNSSYYVSRNIDNFVTLELDLDYWASRWCNLAGSTGIGAIGCNELFGSEISLSRLIGEQYGPAAGFLSSILGDLGFNYNTIDADIDFNFDLNQTFTFRPKPLLVLQSPVDLAYNIFRRDVFGNSLQFRRGGFGKKIELQDSEEVSIRPVVKPTEAFEISVLQVLDNEFQNETEFVSRRSFELKALDVELFVKGKVLLETPEICAFGECCCDVTIKAPDVRVKAGPVISETVPISDNTDSSTLDGNRAPWKLGGFADHISRSIIYNPNFPPIPIIKTDTVVINEGESVKFDDTDSYDPDGGSVTTSWDFNFLPKVRTPQYLGYSGNNIQDQLFEQSGRYTVRLEVYGAFVPNQEPIPVYGFTHIQVNNVAPSIASHSVGTTGIEGQVVSGDVSWSDPGVHDTFRISQDWGDGSPLGLQHYDEVGSAQFSHIYADNGEYSFELCVFDSDGGKDCRTETIIITNAAPTVHSTTTIANFEFEAAIDGMSVMVNAPVLMSFNDLGSADTHTARIDWGDGDSLPISLVTSPPVGPGGMLGGKGGSYQQTQAHAYTVSGDYNVQVCVLDDDGAETCALIAQINIPESDLTLSISRSDSISSVAPVGEAVAYQALVTNNNSDWVGDTMLTFTLPRRGDDLQMSLLSASISAAGSGADRLIPNDISVLDGQSNFGGTLDVEGDTLVVGASGSRPFSSLGGVYVYQKAQGTWQETTRFPAQFPKQVTLSPNEERVAFGTRIVSGHNVSIADQAFKVYRRNDNATPLNTLDDTWLSETVALESGRMSDGFGAYIAIEGDLLVAGAPNEDGEPTISPIGDVITESELGAAYVYRWRDDGVSGATNFAWRFEQRLEGAMPTEYAHYGEQVEIHAGQIYVSQRGEADRGFIGKIDIYTFDNGVWSITQSITSADTDLVVGSETAFIGVNSPAPGFTVNADRLLALAYEPGFGSREFTFLIEFQRNTAGEFVQILKQSLPGNLRNIRLEGERFIVSHQAAIGDLVEIYAKVNGVWVKEQSFQRPGAPRADYAGAYAVDIQNQTAFIGDPNNFKLGLSDAIGAVYVLQACEEVSPGEVDCKVGTIPGNSSRAVTVQAVVNCNVLSDPFVSQLMLASGLIGAASIDTNLTNNVASLSLDSAVPISPVCGVDLTAPNVTADIQGTLGANGWYVSNATVNWTIIDPESAIETTSGCDAQVVNTDTSGQAFTCSTTSAAAASGEGMVTIQRDVTAPIITPTIAGVLGDNGWYTALPTIGFNCIDATSGIAECTADEVLSSDSQSVVRIGTAKDRAGNTATVPVSLKVDTTAPTIDAVANTPLGEDLWSNTDVDITFSCVDAISGVAQCSDVITVTAQGKNQSSMGQAKDKAGNMATFTLNGINIDKTPPLVTIQIDPTLPPSGWFVGAVDLSYSCEDSISGVLVCPEAHSITAQTASQIVSVEAADHAGNIATVNTEIKIDGTPPIIISNITPAPNVEGLRALPVAVSFACDDTLSGVGVCPEPIIITEPGIDIEVRATASDVAGNVGTLLVQGIHAGIPSLVARADVTILEGEVLDGAIAALTHAINTKGTLYIDWGDTTESEIILNSEGGEAPAHIYADDGDYTVTLRVEPALGESLTDSFMVTVNNQVPVLDDTLVETEISPLPQAAKFSSGKPRFTTFIDSSFSLLSVFDDLGSADTHTATMDWGDNTFDSDLAVTELPMGPPGNIAGMSGTVHALHTYVFTGLYEATLCLQDDEGAQVCEDFEVSVAEFPLLPSNPSTCNIEASVSSTTANGLSVPVRMVVKSNAPINAIDYTWSEKSTGLTLLNTDEQDNTVSINANVLGDKRSIFGALAEIRFADNTVSTCQAVCITNGASESILSCSKANDLDSDGIIDRVDNCPLYYNPDQADFEGDGIGDGCDPDSDNDGMLDAYEISHGQNPFNSWDRNEDADGDGFTNIQEFGFGSNPQVADSDNDANGIPDKTERRVYIVPILELLLLSD